LLDSLLQETLFTSAIKMMDPMWTDPGSDHISAPHLTLAGCGGSIEKVSGLKQRVRCDRQVEGWN